MNTGRSPGGTLLSHAPVTGVDDSGTSSASRPAGVVLVVDDEPGVLNAVRLALRTAGLTQVMTCQDPREVSELLVQHGVAVMLLDLVMPHKSGQEVLAEVSSTHPEVSVIVVTADNDLRTVVDCMKRGATDYLTKPMDGDLLVATVQRAMSECETREEARRLREQFFDTRLRQPEVFRLIATDSPAMLRIFGYIEAVARGSQPVLVTGETGSGKELIARAIHDASGRTGPFVGINVAGLDDAMFSDAMFGHSSGAYTGATARRRGMMDRAQAGTLFLDEIGDLKEASQVKLLRVLQEKEYYPLGSDVAQPLSARVVAATHRDPMTLRTDLYYRLRGYHIHVPPLRERPADIAVLVEQFVGVAADDLERVAPKVSSELVQMLQEYHFPGNVRELRAMAFHAVAEARGDVLSSDAFLSQMDPQVKSMRPTDLEHSRSNAATNNRILTDEELQELERANIMRALEHAKWRVSGPGGAADLLGLKPSTLASRMKKFGLTR